jgi:hypothetical protein
VFLRKSGTSSAVSRAVAFELILPAAHIAQVRSGFQHGSQLATASADLQREHRAGSDAGAL